MTSSRIVIAGLAACATLGVAVAQDQNPPERPYGVGEASYSVGYDLGAGVAGTIAEDGLEVDYDELVRGFSDALRGQDPDLDPERMRRILERLHNEVASRLAQQRLEEDPVFRALAEENLRKGRAVQQRFAERERVVTLPSGLMYEPLTTGEGPSAADAETVVVHYESRHSDGSRIASEHTVEFRVASFLDNLQDLLRRMRVGDRWLIIIPPELAYGLAGRDPDIGPNETIILDVELLGVGQ
jgi:FKBP-type peptidyl-prolyl cis-trans isomerase